MNGIINVKKEKGFTSFDVVAKLRGILKMKKIGHTGTLDPDATGVLPVCVGKATRVCDLLTDKDKEYEAVMLLGTVTDTQDITGKILQEAAVTVSAQEVEACVLDFVGAYEQVPPMYSALKVNGKKLCDLARAGIEVERKARTVFLYQIEILDITLPRVHMRVSCSKGTYIRTLCQDIGERLGCGACMESLVRTRVSDFTLKEAKTLTEIETLVKAGRLEEVLQPVDIVFLQLKKAVVYNQFQALLYNGNKMAVSCCALMEGTEELEQIRVYDENNQFVGIYQYLKEEELLKPVKLFME